MAYPTPEEIDSAIPVDGVPSRSLTNTALKAMIDQAVQDALTKVNISDPRLTDARRPTGPAGGVLAGTYPNPEFAEPVATAAQLDTKIDKSQIGVPGGVTPLDSAGVVPLEHLNVSGLGFLGAWNAQENDPVLNDGAGSDGNFYKVSHAGTQDFGTGSYNFVVGDWVMYAAGVWQRIGVHEAVASVNGKLGAVVLTAADVNALPETYVPIWETITGKPDFDSLYVPKRGTISPAIPAVYCGKSVVQTAISGEIRILTWGTVFYDQFGIKSGNEFIVPEWATHIRVTASIGFDPSGDGYRYLRLMRNGSTVTINRNQPVNASASAEVVLSSPIIPASGGDSFRLEAWQNSGGNLGIGTLSTWLQIELYTTN